MYIRFECDVASERSAEVILGQIVAFVEVSLAVGPSEADGVDEPLAAEGDGGLVGGVDHPGEIGGRGPPAFGAVVTELREIERDFVTRAVLAKLEEAQVVVSLEDAPESCDEVVVGGEGNVESEVRGKIVAVDNAAVPLAPDALETLVDDFRLGKREDAAIGKRSDGGKSLFGKLCDIASELLALVGDGGAFDGIGGSGGGTLGGLPGGGEKLASLRKRREIGDGEGFNFLSNGGEDVVAGEDVSRFGRVIFFRRVVRRAGAKDDTFPLGAAKLSIPVVPLVCAVDAVTTRGGVQGFDGIHTEHYAARGAVTEGMA
jgi:hypothetical protein